MKNVETELKIEANHQEKKDSEVRGLKVKTGLKAGVCHAERASLEMCERRHHWR